jgi:hypothetical protein
MGKINKEIMSCGFEVVRDQLANVIAYELFGQFQLSYDPHINAEVLIEDIDPVDQTGLPTVNVSFAGGPYDNKDFAGNSRGTYTYQVDVYTHAKTKQNMAGDYSTSMRLQKILRIIRYVVDNPIYKTLGFSPPFIERVRVARIDIGNAPGNNDAVNSMMGRLTVEVVLRESIDLIIPSLIAGFDTVAMIGNSNRGYFYSNDNYQ